MTLQEEFVSILARRADFIKECCERAEVREFERRLAAMGEK